MPNYRSSKDFSNNGPYGPILTEALFLARPAIGLRILTLEPSRHPELVSCSTCVVLLGRLGAQSCSHELRIGGREALEAQRVRDAESRKHRAEGLISRPQTCGGAEVPRGTYRSASGEDSAPLCLVED